MHNFCGSGTSAQHGKLAATVVATLSACQLPGPHLNHGYNLITAINKPSVREVVILNTQQNQGNTQNEVDLPFPRLFQMPNKLPDCGINIFSACCMERTE